jgi:hypothetical protein
VRPLELYLRNADLLSCLRYLAVIVQLFARLRLTVSKQSGQVMVLVVVFVIFLSFDSCSSVGK